MADLRDQLLKAGLITPDQAKKAEHEKRQKSKRLGHEGKAKEAEGRRAEVREQQKRRQAQDRERGKARQGERQESEREHQDKQKRQTVLERALREGALPRWEGGRPYYFRDGKEVRFLMVNDEAAKALEAGKAAIVRGESRSRYVLIQSGFALELTQAAPERVVTFHRN